MGLEKVTYVDGSTVITAQNLNAIQDSIIDLEASRTVPTNVRNAIYTLLENAAFVTTGLEDEIAIVEAWAEEVTSLTLSASTLSLNNDVPQEITATTVPSGATVTWSSSNNSVATVSDGIVTGVSNGSCVITASAGDLIATCDVTVSGFAVLESISAVYTQSGTVYDTDSLDSLKADLVVTANYSDSSTETIPSTDYTLSGTLTDGTNTITVVYGGKTTTFEVIVIGLPTGYTRLKYVSTNYNQYVNTGINETQCSHAEYEIMITARRKTNGNHICSSVNTYIPFLKGSGGSNYQNLIGTRLNNADTVLSGSTTFNWNLNQKYKIEGYIDGKIYIDNAEIAKIANGGTQSSSNMFYLFTYGGNLSNTDYRISCNLYYCKMYDSNGELLRYFVPAKNSSDVAGLYDYVSETFFTSDSGTALIAGEVE